MMEMLRAKKGSINENVLEKWIVTILLVVVLFKALASLFPEASQAGQDLNDSGFPLGNFFTADGIVWLILAIGLVILMVRTFMTRSKR